MIKIMMEDRKEGRKDIKDENQITKYCNCNVNVEIIIIEYSLAWLPLIYHFIYFLCLLTCQVCRTFFNVYLHNSQ